MRDYLPTMAVIKCLIGQVVDRLEMFCVDECLLWYPGGILDEDVFVSISKNIYLATPPEESGFKAGRHWDVERMHVLLEATISTQEMLDLPTRREDTVTVRSIRQEVLTILEQCRDTLRMLKYSVMSFDREKDVSPLCLSRQKYICLEQEDSS